jgi:transposase
MTVTVLSGPERRRRWTTAEKLRIVEECLAAEAPVVEIARRHDVHPNQLHGWRRPVDTPTQECQFVPIAVSPAESQACEPLKAAVGEAPPIIELVLRNGRILRLPECVTPARAAALAEALEAIAR